MTQLDTTKRRWQAAAEQAMAPERIPAAREMLAAELAQRLWAANGGPAWAIARQEGAVLMLELLAARTLADDMVQSVLALRYLQALEESLTHADYEDQPSLRAELTWTRSFLEGWLPDGNETLSARERLAELYQRAAAALQAELRAAEIAA